MRLLNIVTSPRRERSASIAVIDSFLLEYQKRIKGVVVDTLDVWTESLPEFDAEAIGAKYKGVSGEAMTSSERATWEKIRELASPFQKADRIVLGVPMWNFSFPYKLKQLIDLACQRNMLFTFDGKEYGPALNIDKAFVAYVRGQSEEAGFQSVPPPGFDYATKYIEFWLRFIGVRSIMALTVEHTWDGRAPDMIDEGRKQAVELARKFRSCRLSGPRTLCGAGRWRDVATRLKKPRRSIGNRLDSCRPLAADDR
jgi:FMN-dependent NADH-azoreductase